MDRRIAGHRARYRRSSWGCDNACAVARRRHRRLGGGGLLEHGACGLARCRALCDRACLPASGRWHIAPRAQPRRPAIVRGDRVLSLGSTGARLRRLAGDLAGAECCSGKVRSLAADPRAGLGPDLRSRRADRLRYRLRRGAVGCDPRPSLCVSGPRPASARQFLLGIAPRRRRSDHGDVVRLRLAVKGRRGGAGDLLPDAGEYAGRPVRLRPYGARSDAILRRRLPPNIDKALSAGGAAVCRRSRSIRRRQDTSSERLRKASVFASRPKRVAWRSTWCGRKLPSPRSREWRSTDLSRWPSARPLSGIHPIEPDSAGSKIWSIQ